MPGCIWVCLVCNVGCCCGDQSICATDGIGGPFVSTPLLYLSMSDLGLVGTIDDSWAALPDLIQFDLNNAHITGAHAI